MVKTEGIFLESEILKILSCVVRNLWVVQRFLKIKDFEHGAQNYILTSIYKDLEIFFSEFNCVNGADVKIFSG